MNRSFAPLALLLALTTGCPKDAPVESPVAEPEATQAAPETSPEALRETLGIGPTADQLALAERAEAEGTVVILREPGSEPRQVLAITAPKGHSEAVRMSMGMTMTMSMGAMGSHTTSMPPILSDMRLEVIEELPDDRLVLLAETTSVSLGESSEPLDPMLLAQLEGSLGSLVGMKVQSTMDRQGRKAEHEVRLPDGLDPAMRQQYDSMSNTFSQLTMPLPLEAVGPGARWDTSVLLDNQGMKLLQTSHTELVSIEGDTLTLNTSIEQVLVGQSAMEGLPPGAEVQWLRFGSSGQGVTVQDLGSLTPHDTEVSVELDALMRITIQDQTQDMGIRMAMDMGLEHLGE